MKRMTLDLHHLQIEGESGAINDLVDREYGALVRRNIIEKLRSSQESVICELNLANIHTIDYSCADEVMASIVDQIRAGELGECYLLIKGATTGHCENISAALKRRRLSVISVSELHPDGWDVLGKLEPYLQQLLKLIIKRKSFTARELIEMEDIKLNTASTRLINLYKARLVYRTKVTLPEGGHEYVYHALI